MSDRDLDWWMLVVAVAITSAIVVYAVLEWRYG